MTLDVMGYISLLVIVAGLLETSRGAILTDVGLAALRYMRRSTRSRTTLGTNSIVNTCQHTLTIPYSHV